MTDNLHKAKAVLDSGEYTCVLCCGHDTRTFKKRGVAPLLSLLDSGDDFSSYSAADKVVGNGAAYLYVLLKIKEVYASVISDAAYNTLRSYGITVYHAERVKYIKNRAGDGTCPIELAVSDALSPEDAQQKIRQRLDELR